MQNVRFFFEKNNIHEGQRFCLHEEMDHKRPGAESRSRGRMYLERQNLAPPSYRQQSTLPTCATPRVPQPECDASAAAQRPCCHSNAVRLIAVPLDHLAGDGLVQLVPHGAVDSGEDRRFLGIAGGGGWLEESTSRTPQEQWFS